MIIWPFFFWLLVSPDGLLLQSSTVADSVSFQFADGITESVPCSYIEFAERQVLPQYKNIPEIEVTNLLLFFFSFFNLTSWFRFCVSEIDDRKINNSRSIMNLALDYWVQWFDYTNSSYNG